MSRSSRAGTWWSRATLGLLLIAILLAVATGSASAHANLVRSDPAAGASLTKAPTKVQLWFSEELEPSFSSAVIYDGTRNRVDANDSHVAPDDDSTSHMLITLHIIQL